MQVAKVVRMSLWKASAHSSALLTEIFMFLQCRNPSFTDNFTLYLDFSSKVLLLKLIGDKKKGAYLRKSGIGNRMHLIIPNATSCSGYGNLSAGGH